MSQNNAENGATSATELAFGFSGTHPLKLDSSQRVAIPAKFVQVLENRYAESKRELACVAIGPRLRLFPIPEYRKIHEKLEAASNLNSTATKAKGLLSANMKVLELDAQNRVRLTPYHVGKAGLQREVAVVGQINVIEIWDAERWTQYDSQEDLDALLDQAFGA
jgi:MraZ protein